MKLGQVSNGVRGLAVGGVLYVLLAVGAAALAVEAGPVAVAFASGLVVALSWLTVRAARAGLTVRTDQLVVRNLWRTRRVPIGDVAGLELADGGVDTCVHVRLTDGGTVPVTSVAGRRFFGGGGDPQLLRKLEVAQDLLARATAEP